MTISEQLNFSVLSAPLAGTDRRALSQAWYSALYRTSDKKARLSAREFPSQCRTAAPLPAAARSSSPAAFGTLSRTGRARKAEAAATAERRTPQLRLARQIEHLVRRRAPARTAATFILDGTRARVRVLVIASGGSVRLIAVCSKRVRDSVARALEQARYASAEHGIVLHATMREDAPC
ncbi:MAG TPA: hypothetical protein VFW34_04155 [Candidatus Rubrimentiphilum sp.]|nr:hypothetical protein [Candidatus Rubrimentiphilum sp.]